MTLTVWERDTINHWRKIISLVPSHLSNFCVLNLQLVFFRNPTAKKSLTDNCKFCISSFVWWRLRYFLWLISLPLIWSGLPQGDLSFNFCNRSYCRHLKFPLYQLISTRKKHPRILILINAVSLILNSSVMDTSFRNIFLNA